MGPQSGLTWMTSGLSSKVWMYKMSVQVLDKVASHHMLVGLLMQML